MVKHLLLILVFVFGLTSIHAEKYETSVAPIEGECWWGAATGLGKLQPFGKAFEKFDLNRSNQNNQAAPLLVSNKGRYIWSDEPFAFSIQDGTLTLYSDYE